MTIIIDETKGITAATWTTAGRPSTPAASQQGFNTTLNALEVYDGTQWNLISEGQSATGGIITTDGTHTIHTLLNSGTFTPNIAGTVDYLVVAGGGGGGGYCGGGGGAGGFKTATGFAVAATGITVTVGAGGAGGSDVAVSGSNGSNSVFSTITSTGGGYGAHGTSALDGGVGGSGGGATKATTASGTVGQGNSGGAGTVASSQGGGGGGGASAAGSTGTAGAGGNGGAGTANSFSGTAITYAGGGGGGNGGSTAIGGAGGAGGGGTGTGASSAVNNGTVNTGGGGGGAGYPKTYPAGDGGSGVVIIRYPIVTKANLIGQGPQIMIVQHQEAMVGGGGDAVAGVNIRDLNIVQFSNLVGASLSSKQITLSAGTYRMKGWAGCYHGNNHKAYVYDVTNSRRVIAGSSEHAYSSSYDTCASFVNGVISTTGTTVFELRHHIIYATTSGLGTATGVTTAGPEVYAELEITRIA